MSDVQATTQDQGVAAPADAETHFENLWDAGAFDKDGKRPDEEIGDQPQEEARTEDRGHEEETQQESRFQEGEETEEQREAPAYKSLDEFLTAHKADPESFKSLAVKVKIDGQEKEVPLSDVLKSYQLEGHVNNKSIELSNQRTQFEQERNAARELMRQQLQQNSVLGQSAMQMLNHDYQKIDWNSLRMQNPGEYAALQNEFQQRQQAIQYYLQQVQQQTQVDAQQQQQALQQRFVAEREKMFNARPDWRDEAVFTKDREQMTKYARSLGFQDAELSQIVDHRYMQMAHDAARYQELQAQKPNALKQVREAPRMAKPGSRTDTNPNEARRQEAIQRFNRNPRDVDAQEALFSNLIG
jgi:hypothetical protein